MRYAVLVPLKNKKATTVVHSFQSRWICPYGFPAAIMSDNGGEFDNDLMVAVCTGLGIGHIKSSPYHPQANGVVERLNRTILNLMRPYVDDACKDWDRFLPQMAAAYNSSPHASLGNISPYQCLYGATKATKWDRQLQLGSGQNLVTQCLARIGRRSTCV